jgi:hypothetical protein
MLANRFIKDPFLLCFHSGIGGAIITHGFLFLPSDTVCAALPVLEVVDVFLD